MGAVAEMLFNALSWEWRDGRVEGMTGLYEMLLELSCALDLRNDDVGRETEPRCM